MPFSEMAITAYAKAISLNDKTAEFPELQKYYRGIMDAASSYRGRLCTFLERLLPQNQGLLSPPSQEETLSAIQELSQNLHLLEDNLKPSAKKLLDVAQGQPFSDLNIIEIGMHAIELFFMLTTGNDLTEETDLIKECKR